jgi:translation initiation factor IF-3
VPIKRAQEIANEQQLDLVKIAPQAKPPVCRIMDYGKYRYELSRKEKEARKNQKIINIKEVRLSPSIEDHDFDVKLKNAIKFLNAGDKVKVSIRFRGREIGHASVGLQVLKRFAEQASEISVIEKPAKLEGKSMIMILAPKQV